MCGKANPEGAEICWSCQARLTPLIAPQPPADDSSAPDWLSGLRGQDSAADDFSAEQEPAPPADEPPDWLARIRQRSSEDRQPEPEGDDWLKNLSGTQPSESQEDNLPDWLKGSQEAAAEAETPAGSSDWLGSLRAEQPAQDEPVEEEQPASPAPAGGDAEPDWLATLASWNTGDEPTAPVEESAAADEEVAQAPAEEVDWLRSLPDEPLPEALPPAEPAESAPGDLPGWLGQTTAADEPAVPLDTGELSDWFSGLNIQPPATGDLPPAEPSADWSFSRLSDQDEQPQDSGSSSPPALESAGEFEGSPETPFSSPFVGEEDAAPAREAGEDTPDWLKNFSANLAADEPAEEPDLRNVSEDSGQQPFVGAEIEGWLDENDEEPAPGGEEAGESLEAATLPGWLQAMRPVEAVVSKEVPPAEDRQKIEKAGPLAGLVGTLPGEDLVAQVRKPPVYASRLQVSERQRQSAAMIEELLAEEAKPRPARAERKPIPAILLRLLVALALLLAVLYPLVTGSQAMPLPDLYPPETVLFHSLVDGLPEQAPVLLAVDYEPGLSGEMQLTAGSVVDHLMARNARLAVMSTVATGPVLADALLADAQTRQPGYSLIDQTLNLGFLPGGTAGLQEFASRPQVALQYTADGKRLAWTEPVLQGVTGLKNFSLVVVMTDNAETARAWVEQVSPFLNGGQVPLLFVTSAQAAPFIQPYIDSAQVQGLVSGLAGGTMYRQITQQPGPERAYWDAYQYGLFLAVILVLGGGLIQVFLRLARRSSRKGA